MAPVRSPLSHPWLCLGPFQQPFLEEEIVISLTMLFAINTGFVVSCALSRIGLVRSLGGVAAPVVFDTGLAWSASCKGNLAPPPPIYPILL